jgi:hypothetical protein
MVQPVGSVQKTAELDLDMGKKSPQEQPQPKNPGKAAIVDLSPEVQKSIAELREFVSSGPKSHPKPYSDLGPKTSGSGVGGDFGFGIQKMNKDIKRNYKKGGTVKSASSRADGCCIKGKTKA